MEVRQLQIFRTLAEELNFTRTPEKVHTVQSNVTRRSRHSRRAWFAAFRSTGPPRCADGRRAQLLPFANQALAAMEQGQRAVQSGAEPSGPLRIGAPESVLTYRLPAGCCVPIAADFPMSNSLSVLIRMRRLRSSLRRASSIWRSTCRTSSPQPLSSPCACVQSGSSS